VWHMAALDRLYIPDGVVLQGAGMGKTALVWPGQTGADCVQTGWPSHRLALIQGGTSKAGTVRGWGMEDLAVVVDGGFVQNDTKAYCAAIAPCSAPGCTSVGMTLKRVNVSAVAPTGGVNVHSGGGGSGAVGAALREWERCHRLKLHPLWRLWEQRVPSAGNGGGGACSPRQQIPLWLHAILR
jgi:hypothetical protein